VTGVRVDDNWTYHGLRLVRLENRHLAIEVLPERGANIFRLIDKRRDLDLLWKSPRVTPHVAAVHADFDDHWAGGWDDAFPGGRACRNRYGDLLPYMGEVWTARAGYRIETGDDRVTLTTTVRTPVTPAELTRELTLSADEPRFTLRYSLRNIGTLPFDYNWGVHPSLAVRPGMRFDIPATHGLVDEAGGDVLGHPGEEYQWPLLRGYDLRQSDSAGVGAFALHYLTGLTARLPPGPDRAVDRLPEPAGRGGRGRPGAAARPGRDPGHRGDGGPVRRGRPRGGPAPGRHRAPMSRARPFTRIKGRL
jgi:hypothetical protein